MPYKLGDIELFFNKMVYLNRWVESNAFLYMLTPM